MKIKAAWTELTAQQLVRHEALFKLLEDTQGIDDVAQLARRAATQWKYFANVASFRLAVTCPQGFLIVDGFRGEARVKQQPDLPPWDAHHWQALRPSLVSPAEPHEGPPPPAHLAGRNVAQIEVIPFLREGRCIAVLSAAGRHEPFSELDQKFIRMFGGHFAQRVSDLLLREAALNSLISKATHDALTGLLNRGAIMERLAAQLALARRTGQALSVVLADVDHFKQVNDTLGHQAGDTVLVEVAQRLNRMTRVGDHLGRYGGEEFLFVLYPCSAEEAVAAAERFRRAVAGDRVSLGAGADERTAMTISLGTASSGAGGDEAVDTLLRRADDALYLAKSSGRNRVVAADASAPTPG
jgi:diguanylate cyclase (GGDEF)-like protein